MTKKPELLTPLEAAERLGVKRNRVYAWCRTGAIACHRVGGRYFIPAWAVEKAQRGEDPRPPQDPLDNEYLTIQQASAVLGISDRAIYEWCRKGEIPFRRPGLRYQIPREEVLKRLQIVPARPEIANPEKAANDAFIQALVDSGAIPDPRTVPPGGEDSFDWDAFERRKNQSSTEE